MKFLKWRYFKRATFAFCVAISFGLLAASCNHIQPTPSQATAGSPTTEDHWHVAIGFYICGKVLPYPDLNQTHPPFFQDGIQFPFSYKDGVIHVSPTPDTQVEGETNLSFTLGDLASRVGFQITDDTLTVLANENQRFSSANPTVYNEATGCTQNQTASLSVIRWQLDGANPEQLGTPEVATQNLSAIRLEKNFDAFTIAFLPEGSALPPIPFSALELLKLPSAEGRLPSAREMGLIPARPAPLSNGDTIAQATLPCPTETESRRVTKFEVAFIQRCFDTDKTYRAIFKTTLGEIEVELDNRTPFATSAFITLALYNYYDGSAFFRTDPKQGIIQGGAVHSNRVDDEGPGFTIADDNLDFTYEPGQLIMARNKNPHSGNGQFIFTASENAKLLAGSESSRNLVVFGKVVRGLSVLEKVLSLHAEEPEATEDSQFFLGGPIVPVILTEVTIQETDS